MRYYVRGRRRPGTRQHAHVNLYSLTFHECVPFLFSGIDSEGHAANFVETEQIVQYNNSRASFVQVIKSQYESAFISKPLKEQH